MAEDVAQVLLTEEQIAQRVAEMGAQISQDYAGKELMLVCILEGRKHLYGGPGPADHHPPFLRLRGGFFLRGGHQILRRRAYT